MQLVAFIAAWHTCMSRVSDFKHHYTDVIAGAIIGISVAIFVVIYSYISLEDLKNIKQNNIKQRNIQKLNPSNKATQFSRNIYKTL